VFGALGGAPPASAAGDGEERPVRSVGPDDVATTLEYEADSVVLVPGYGLAVAQAQSAMAELAAALEAKGKRVRFAIHPVAGRMPGHMNVLLAEADVPPDKLLDLDDINDEFAETDAVVVVGANDVVNGHAHPERGRGRAGGVRQAQPLAGLRGRRQPALLRRGEDHDAVLRRQGGARERGLGGEERMMRGAAAAGRQGAGR
jgi:hypothetical protein